MSAFLDFLAMDGYAFYVWGSYVVTFALMAFEVIALKRRKKAVLQRLARSRQHASEGDI